jgi:hypothetical protein
LCDGQGDFWLQTLSTASPVAELAIPDVSLDQRLVEVLVDALFTAQVSHAVPTAQPAITIRAGLLFSRIPPEGRTANVTHWLLRFLRSAALLFYLISAPSAVKMSQKPLYLGFVCQL